MDDLMILDTVERYIRGEMNPDERLYFENLRKTNPEVDQLVVEHTLFLQQMNRFDEVKKFKTTLHQVHTDLAEKGEINAGRISGKTKVVYLWNRYKRVAAIAASIAGITTLAVSLLVNTLSPKADNDKLLDLSREVKQVKEIQNAQNKEVNNLKTKITDTPIPFRTAGTGFMIDGKGFLITNAHIVRNSRNIFVINSDNEQFRANLVFTDVNKDIAILKITDADFKPITSLPYGIRKASTDVAEPVYTLGFPRNEIVYSEGYLSAKTGFNGDTLSCQLGIAANPGNSGGPVFNQDGEVVGILSTKETQAEGVAFAIQSKYIFDVVDALKKDTAYQKIKLPVKSSLTGMNKKQQVKKLEDFIFLVKVN
jgi:serine protease Do